RLSRSPRAVILPAAKSQCPCVVSHRDVLVLCSAVMVVCPAAFAGSNRTDSNCRSVARAIWHADANAKNNRSRRKTVPRKLFGGNEPDPPARLWQTGGGAADVDHGRNAVVHRRQRFSQLMRSGLVPVGDGVPVV